MKRYFTTVQSTTTGTRITKFETLAHSLIEAHNFVLSSIPEEVQRNSIVKTIHVTSTEQLIALRKEHKLLIG